MSSTPKTKDTPYFGECSNSVTIGFHNLLTEAVMIMILLNFKCVFLIFFAYFPGMRYARH